MTDLSLQPANYQVATSPILPSHLRSKGQSYGFSGQTVDLKVCSAAIRRGSKSFHLASLLLPREPRLAARSIYAFCRHADDLIDDVRASHLALDQLRRRLDLIYRGTPAAYACDRAFARIIETYAIPKTIPFALLEGFDMDISNRRYRSIDEVRTYATRVASTVGVMMTLVMRTASPEALARAADLGIAMQLTNIARDVGEDARNGRLYLPTDWLEEAGIDPAAFLAEPRFTPALGRVVERLLEEAARFYRSGHAGITLLPKTCRKAIRASALIYERIGWQIAANGFDSVSHRARTTLPGKLAMAMRACAPNFTDGHDLASVLAAPVDPAAEDLVTTAADALAAAPRVTGNRAGRPERFLSIMMQLQDANRTERRFRRLAIEQKAARLV
jgi:15-cis-phytoene synthase